MSQQSVTQPVPRLKTRYNEELVPALMKEFSYKSVMQVPRLEKISVNIGLGEALQNSKALLNRIEPWVQLLAVLLDLGPQQAHL